ncbi:MAG: ABC transporter ATP-binding protein [Ignavibacteriales bacterium]
MSTVIKVEGLGKKYLIGHKKRERYVTLRDTITNGFLSVSKKVVRPFLKTNEEHQLYEEFWALKDINFEIKQGERIGIIGRNGAGKSTLLKLLSRITEPTTGRISLKGRVASLLEVGTGFHPELTGRENIYLNGTILGMSRAEIKKKFDEIVDFAEIEKFLDTPVKRYSSGMYVRLAFAVAAHLEPEILIVDEVLAVGDAQFQKKCLGKMGEVGKEGRTVLFVSHNMAALTQICKKSILLESGRIAEMGNIDGIIRRYLSFENLDFTGDIDLTSQSLRRNSIEKSLFKWIRAKVINSQGIMTTSIRLKEPFDLLITGILKETVNDLEIGFGVMSEMGFPLFNSHLADTRLPKSFPSGELTFKISFTPNILSPGSYTIDLGANGSGIVDWIPEAIKINIEPVSLNQEEYIRSTYSGVVMYPCEWSMV